MALEREALVTLLGDLTTEQWLLATPCEAWNVHELALHILGVDFALLSRRRDRHFGTEPPSDIRSDTFPAWLDDLQREWVTAARRISPALVMELLAWSAERLAEVFEGEDPHAVTAHVSWAGPELMPVWLDHLRELSEFWIHRQQLLEAVGRQPDLHPELLAAILDGLRWAYPYGIRHVKPQHGAEVQIEVFGELDVTWTLRYRDRWRFEVAGEGEAVAAIRLSADNAWRLLTNNLPETSVAQIEARGPTELVDALLRTRAIIGDTKWREWSAPQA